MNRRAVSARASLKSESIWTCLRVCRPTVLPTPKTCLAYCGGLYRGGCLPLRNGTFMDGLTPALKDLGTLTRQGLARAQRRSEDYAGGCCLGAVVL
ncbi:hypothetical protein CDAR_168411 [Caerostris darwini]|uniref:Uncharacterized protein n=1 Tax=Caerostris darwini TaxID=1538125 RepID=A0AAV4T6Z6_9ARAC|nr:hypothetical protein CDAR_168411 [Caerostris darwini]